MFKTFGALGRRLRQVNVHLPQRLHLDLSVAEEEDRVLLATPSFGQHLLHILGCEMGMQDAHPSP